MNKTLRLIPNNANKRHTRENKGEEKREGRIDKRRWDRRLEGRGQKRGRGQEESRKQDKRRWKREG